MEQLRLNLFVANFIAATLNWFNLHTHFTSKLCLMLRNF